MRVLRSGSEDFTVREASGESGFGFDFCFVGDGGAGSSSLEGVAGFKGSEVKARGAEMADMTPPKADLKRRKLSSGGEDASRGMAASACFVACSSFCLLASSAFLDCCCNRSRTGVDCRSLRAARAFVTDTEDAVGVPRRAPGIPLFSARLLAIEDWGSLRREGARVGEEVLGGGEVVLFGAAFEGGESAEASKAWGEAS